MKLKADLEVVANVNQTKKGGELMSLEDIQAKAKLRSPRLVVYGGAGVGKTTWASKMGKPVAILTEDGLGTTRNATLSTSAKSGIKNQVLLKIRT